MKIQEKRPYFFNRGIYFIILHKDFFFAGWRNTKYMYYITQWGFIDFDYATAHAFRYKLITGY